MPCRPRMMPPVGKSGPGTMLMRSSIVSAGIVDQRHAGVDHFAEIVRRDVGRHADGDAAGAVDQKVGEFAPAAPSVHGRGCRSWPGNRRCPCRCRRAASARPWSGGIRCTAWRPRVSPSTEPKLPWPSISGTRMEKSCAMTHQRVIDRLIAVRMVFTDDVADRARRLACTTCSTRSRSRDIA